MSGMIRILTLISFSLILFACGGGGGDNPWYTSTTDTTTTTTDTTSGNTTTAAIYLGSGSGASFSAGTLNIGVTSLSAGGTTSVTATLADADGNLYQDSASVSFTSTCVASSLASITTPITTSNGVASTTYNAEGCSGNDTITATATVNSVTRTATGTLTVQPAVIGSMQFVSATPSIIGIKGFGLNEVAEVVFRVLDTNGNPVSGQQVTFTLSTTVGGITIPNTTDTSDINGLVRANVQSGTISTTVRVTASLTSNPSISTQSDGLTVSTGVADQSTISLSLTNKNPEAWIHDGVEVGVNVIVSDHFRNPVPDGTAITFTTEGGQIQSQCLTSNGRCSVTWTSSNPRPPSTRVTILASMLGEEAFNDANGNGVLDNTDTFTDVPEAFRDDDESGTFGANSDGGGSEEFLDFNTNGHYDTGDGEYNGVLCCDVTAVTNAVAGELCFGKTYTPLTCSSSKNIHVRADNFIVMGASSLSIEPSVSSVAVSGNVVQSFNVYVFNDVDGSGTATLGDQVPPSGTVISISTTNGTLESPASVTVPSTNADGVYSVPVRWRGDTTSSSGTLSIKATVPSGIVSGPVYVPVSD